MTLPPHNTDTPTVHALHESRARLTEIVSKSKYWPPGKPRGELLTEDEIDQLRRDMDRDHDRMMRDWPNLIGWVARIVTRNRELEAAQSRRQRPHLKTLLERGRKAGAPWVAWDGVTYGCGAPPADAPTADTNPFELEAARLRQLKRGDP